MDFWVHITLRHFSIFPEIKTTRTFAPGRLAPNADRRAPISTRTGRTEFLKINAALGGWRDTYHWILCLSWPRFVAFLLAVYFAINLVFATAYALGGPCIGEMTPGSFPESLFFSIETLATVGYGHMYPANVYGHVVVTTEIIVGMFWVAVITGLIFVRFARPTARIVFSNCLVIAPFDGRLSIMYRVANLRHTSMAEAEFRLLYSRDERVAEGDDIRRFYELKVYPERMISFPAALIIRHTIDEQSPLHGITPEDPGERGRLFRCVHSFSRAGHGRVSPKRAGLRVGRHPFWRAVRRRLH